MVDRPRPHEFAYLDSDIPPGMTIREWRARRAAARRVPTRRPRFPAASGPRSSAVRGRTEWPESRVGTGLRDFVQLVRRVPTR
jgi:hypothetical protein